MASNRKPEVGPIYGVKLLDSLPLDGGSMRQAKEAADTIERQGAEIECLKADLADLRNKAAAIENDRNRLWCQINGITPREVAENEQDHRDAMRI